MLFAGAATFVDDIGDFALAASTARLAIVVGMYVGPVLRTVLNRNPDLTLGDPIAIADVHFAESPSRRLA